MKEERLIKGWSTKWPKWMF